MFPISRDPPEGGTARWGQKAVTPDLVFPISRDPPEGGTKQTWVRMTRRCPYSFQFLGIPPKGEHERVERYYAIYRYYRFPISRDPPEGGTPMTNRLLRMAIAKWFPISRDPPEGGTASISA